MYSKSRAMPNGLVVRADADSRMGTGHVMRCIALGQAWQDAGGGVVFITCCNNAALLQRLRDENFTVVELSHPDEFIPRLLSDLRPQAPDLWSVLDGYRFDLNCQRAVRAAGFKLLLIDDYNHLPEYECDILLNQNINAPDLNYCVNPDAKLLLGTQYALLRREFQRRKGFQPFQGERNRNILVTLGGVLLFGAFWLFPAEPIRIM